jgi:hypothetical protein
MDCSSPLLTPECTPARPEIVETSTPWSDVLLEELQTAGQFRRPGSQRYRSAKFANCRTRFRYQNKILCLTILMLFGLLLAERGGRRGPWDDSELVTQPKLEGLQFIDANHPSIRVRQLMGVRQATANLAAVRWPLDIDCRWNA